MKISLWKKLINYLINGKLKVNEADTSNHGKEIITRTN
jgi:hypothetical protein